MHPQDGTDPAAIVVSRRTLGWAGAALFALFSGGQVASLRLADDGPDPMVAALSARMDAVSTKVDQLTADGTKRDVYFNEILSAVLIWQLEQDRYWRETRQPNTPPRSAELEAASQRLRDLANRH
jgi:Flp pilus assembly protein CpaB